MEFFLIVVLLWMLLILNGLESKLSRMEQAAEIPTHLENISEKLDKILESLENLADKYTKY